MFRALCLSLFALSTASAAAAEARTAVYKQRHTVIDSDLNSDPRQCRKEGGVYDGMCMAPATDEIRITVKNGTYKVAAETFGNDFDGCLFEGRAQRSGNILYAKDKDSACRATITLRGNHAAFRAEEGEACGSLCGMHATLDIPRAKRVK